MCRFPHLEILPWNSTCGEFLRSSLHHSATQAIPVAGCSPILCPVEVGWIGMVVGADEENPATFAAEAEPLLDFFETATGRKYGPLKSQQFT